MTLKKHLPLLFLLLAVLLGEIVSSNLRPVHAAGISWAVSLDAASTSQTDVALSSSASNAKSFRVGAIVNATDVNPLNGVFGWQFAVTYHRTVFAPQGDPNPLATSGNSLGLYPDGAVNTVLFGAQTTAGSVNWAGLANAGYAFASYKTNSTIGKITVFFSMLGQNPPVNIAANTLLANVNFELLNKTTTPQSFRVSDIVFVDGSDSPLSSVVAGTSVVETVTNDPPHAKFSTTSTPMVGPHAFTFNAKPSSDTDDKIPNAGGYLWDFGDGTQDLGLTGSVVTHNFTSAGAFDVTLRVYDVPGATGASRDSLGNVMINTQPSHTYTTIDPPSGTTTAWPSLPTNGCLSLSLALVDVTSSSQFQQFNSTGRYKYRNYGVGTDGSVCRMVLSFDGSSGNTLEAVVNPDGSLASLVQFSASGRNFSSSPSPIWSGYEAQCQVGSTGCNNGNNQIQGAYMEFSVPTAYSPTSGAALLNLGGTDCCIMATWVGVGNKFGGQGLLVQAGIQKATDSQAKWNNVPFYELIIGNTTIGPYFVNWPCSSSIGDGDIMSVLVQEISTDSSKTVFQFVFRDSNLYPDLPGSPTSSLNCQFTTPITVYSGPILLSWGYFIVESPTDTNTCTGRITLLFTNVCEIPAWELPIWESGWLLTSCCGYLPIDSGKITPYQVVMDNCIDSDPGFANVLTTPLPGNLWSSLWLTSVRQDQSSTNPCSKSFSLSPYPNPLIFLQGNTVRPQSAVNSVDGYSGTLTFTTTSKPSAGLSVSCPSITLSPKTVSPEYCTFTSSTPGIYTVNITATDGVAARWALMTVIVATNQWRQTLFIPTSFSNGVWATISAMFFAGSGTLTGFMNVTATDSVGKLLYEKDKLVNSSRIVDVMSISPNWFSLNCNVSLSTGLGSCTLTRTLDIDHDGKENIVDLALVALCFASWPCTPNLGASSPISYCAPQCALSVDLNADNTINILDLADIALSFGATVYPP